MTHKVKFYVDPQIAYGYNDLLITNWLQTIINTCNSVFTRNGVKVTFQYDGYDATTWQCPLRTGSQGDIPGGLKAEDYNIHIELKKGGGGAALWSTDGGTTLAGIRCFGISTVETEMAFWDLVFVIIHEYVHSRGKVGEFYYYPTLKDYTKVAPIAPDCSITKENDYYWTASRRASYINDPMTMTIGPSAIVFAPLHVYYLNVLKLRTQPLLKRTIRVIVKNTSGSPISGANCQSWYQLITGTVQNVFKDAEGITDGVGSYSFYYENDDPDDYIDRDPSYRIIKVKANGYKSKAVYLTLVDIEEQQIMKGYKDTEVSIILEPGQDTEEPTTPTEEQITASIINPKNGDIFTAPAGIMIQANATSTQSISKVEFFNGTASLGTVTAAPYSIGTSLSVGSYSLYAKVTGKTKTINSNTVNITVNKATEQPPTSETPTTNEEVKQLKDSIIALKNSINALNSKIDSIASGSVGINIKLNK